ncbi:conserved unknown protein [Ectocarpus siliculosus]|uniref:START domain-containing protein n=1 Tax=Ectocarpus siliculosus TaxID=2880 RepID=D7G7Z6_ECTSI|nr:conserved unknown protein [Ectocarpus siliculosus]|eukprot:CBJ27871.1 conserved unknown protein [Ectocarpus siliculosus]
MGPTGASLFKRKRTNSKEVQPSGGVPFGKGGKRGKVKEDVAWLLEDTSDGGWKPVRDDGHVQVWKRSMPNSDFVAIKSKASLAVSPQALFEVLTPGDIEIVRQYNPLVEDGIDLEVIDRDNKVSWSATMGIWPCRPRDFVTHIQRATLEDGSVAIVNSATSHPKAPAGGKYVRGEILHGVFHIKAAKNKKHSEFTMVHHFSPGGNIPPWLMNWLAEGKPITFVRKLEEVAKKWDRQAALTKSMPCKGRGFADKPCAFLLPTGDSSEEGDTLAAAARAAAGGGGGEWGSLVKALTMAALLAYAWALFFDRRAVFGKKGEPSAAGPGRMPAEEKSGTLHSRVALPAKHEKLAVISREQSAGVPAVVISGAVPHAHADGEKAGPDGRDVKDLRGPSGDVQHDDVLMAEGGGGEVVPGRGELAGATAEKEDPSPTPAREAPREECGALAERAEVPPASSSDSREEPDTSFLDGEIANGGIAGQVEGSISRGGGVEVTNSGPTAVASAIGGEAGDCGAAAVEDATSVAVADTGAGVGEPATAVGRSDTIVSGDNAPSGDVVIAEVRSATDADRAAISVAPAVFNVGNGELPRGNISSGEVWSTPLPVEGISNGEGSSCEILVKE